MFSFRAWLKQFLAKEINFKKYLIISIVVFVSGAFMSFVSVPMIEKTIVKYLGVLKPGHFVRSKHEHKLPFTYKLYLWNVTNPNEVSAGTEKPKMQEVGPYVFNQVKRKIQTKDNEEEDTFSFDVWNVIHFSPQLSAPLTGDEVVTLLNLVLVPPVIKIKYESPANMMTVIEALNTVLKNPSSIFSTMKAIDFINVGYEIFCNETGFAAKAMCAELKRTKTLKMADEKHSILRYRWFDKLNDTKQARFTVMRGSNDIRNVGRTVAVNQKRIMKLYRRDENCIHINGTDETVGTVHFYHPFQKKSDVMYAYSHEACKSFPLRYQYMERVRGVKTAWKNLDLGDVMMNPKCECNPYIGCFPHGSVDMHPCLHIFVLGSLPHFYGVDPSILSTVEGMNPKKDLHKCGINFDLKTGTPILVYERWQVNFLVQRVPQYPIFSSINGEFWMPVFWYEESFSILKPDLALIISSKIATNLGIATGYMLMIVGFIRLVHLAVRFQNRTLVIPAVVVSEAPK